MKTIFSALVLTIALTGTGFAGGTEDAVNTILGKKLYGDDLVLTVKKNGKITGKWKGDTLKGAWEIRDGDFCRTMSVNGQELGTSCQAVQLVEGGVKFSDVKGANRKPRIYTFRKP
ncbi:MAG: hypothetical protein AAGA63_13700 [Pseudomonadota bacterium]